jgi:hypothetical protein
VILAQRKVDISTEGGSDLVGRTDPYSQGFTDIERQRIRGFEASGYFDPAVAKSMQPPIDRAIKALSVDKTLSKRDKKLKELLLRYLKKYLSNPEKYVVHPKQIKNLPTWFEDALVLFKDSELSPEMKRNVRKFFYNLIAWRDQESVSGAPDEGEMGRQYGLSANPYNPEGLTYEEARDQANIGDLEKMDLTKLTRGLRQPDDFGGSSEMKSMGGTPLRGLELEEEPIEPVSFTSPQPISSPVNTQEMSLPILSVRRTTGVAPMVGRSRSSVAGINIAPMGTGLEKYIMGGRSSGRVATMKIKRTNKPPRGKVARMVVRKVKKTKKKNMIGTIELPRLNLNVRKSSTSDIVSRMRGMNTIGAGSTSNYIKTITSNMVKSIPTMKPIKERGVKESSMLSNIIASISKSVRGSSDLGGRQGFSIPDMSPMEFDFNMFRKKKKLEIKSPEEEEDVEYVEYLSEV